MAFGFGFNKQKVLSAAEKCVQQGKLQNAIAEYEKILKADPKDLTVSNTVGDLYARLGQTDRAIECFKSVGDAYASQGFTVKAIAMYKKLTKLRPTLEGVLRLAELYTQQGLFNDARAQYLQVAEEFLRAGELEQAVRIFQKTLEMDPENVNMRTRLADVYIRLGKKTEAWQIYSAAAESLRGRGQLAAAEEILDRMLKLDPSNSYALLLRGKNAIDSGDVAAGIQQLEKVADLDSHPDGLRTLLQAYIQSGRLAEAGTLATKLLTVHNDATAILPYAEALMANGQYEDLLQVYREHADRLLAGDPAKVLESLHSLIGHIRENTGALESVLELFSKAGDTTHLAEVYELLAHAYVQTGALEKARDYYLKLTQLEPENQLHARNYQQVIAQMGGGTAAPVHLITAEEGAVLVDELEATAPAIDQRYADDLALAIRAALTDAELFISYNMPAKALGPLMSALPLAPTDLRINQRLAALHTRASRFGDAAVCCRTLQSIYHDAGHAEEAARYAELATQYEQRAAVMPAKPQSGAPIEESRSVAPAQTPAEPRKSGLFFHTRPAAAEPAEFEVQAAPEQDVSQEWEGAFEDESQAAAAVVPEPAPAVAQQPAPIEAKEDREAIAETEEEIRFYISQSMRDQAFDALAKLTRLTKDTTKIASLRQEIEAAPAVPVPEVEGVAVEQVDTFVEPEPTAPEPKPAALDEFVQDLESSLGHFGQPATSVVTPPVAAQPVSAPEPQPEPEYVEATAEADTLGEFVADLETSLGDGFVPAPEPAAILPVPEPMIAQTQVAATAQAAPPPVARPSAGAAAAAAPALAPAPKTAPAPAFTAPAPAIEATPAPAAATPAFTYEPTKPRPLADNLLAPSAKGHTAAGIDLADMFGDLKQELEEEVASADEDPETHYNLGVAFREMGLLDEAIGELQKVCQAVDRGHPFKEIMQTYTWLAQCFLDKGVPEAAIRWYESALKLPGVDQETAMALHYELGSSYEIAGNKAAALQHFMEVYGSNIDYRDVAQRIQALKS